MKVTYLGKQGLLLSLLTEYMTFGKEILTYLQKKLLKLISEFSKVIGYMIYL